MPRKRHKRSRDKHVEADSIRERCYLEGSDAWFDYRSRETVDSEVSGDDSLGVNMPYNPYDDGTEEHEYWQLGFDDEADGE